MSIPAHGCSPAEALAALAALRVDDPPVHGGRVLAYVYDAGVDGLAQVGRDALAAFGEVNGLDPTVFSSVARIENDLVGWGLDLLGGGVGGSGLVTSGGTESCMLAVLAARESWRRAHGEARTTASIVLPVTAHPAFAKAAHVLGLRLCFVPVDPVDMRVRVESVAAALDEEGPDAALVVVSAPSYPHGVVDPIRAVAELAAERGVPCHVDACIGGFVLPYLRRAGRPVPQFDLSVPGVRSISADLHKYGYAPKGASLLLFGDVEYREGTFFSYSRWPGYPVVNTTLQSTRSAGPMAAAWAVIRVLGDDGMAQAVVRCIEATDRIVAGVADIPGLRVLGPPDSTLIAIAAEAGSGSAGVDPFVLADRMRARGWIIQPQPAFGGLPRTAHLTVQPASLATVAEFVADLARAAGQAADQPWASADRGLVELAGQLDASALTTADVAGLLAVAGLGEDAGPKLPAEAAGVHALIEALPEDLRERLLSGFFSLLFTPQR